jgi:hypothetical protein
MHNFDEATITGAADGREMAQPYYHLNYDFGLKAETETSHAGGRAA